MSQEGSNHQPAKNVATEEANKAMDFRKEKKFKDSCEVLGLDKDKPLVAHDISAAAKSALVKARDTAVGSYGADIRNPKRNNYYKEQSKQIEDAEAYLLNCAKKEKEAKAAAASSEPEKNRDTKNNEAKAYFAKQREMEKKARELKVAQYEADNPDADAVPHGQNIAIYLLILMLQKVEFNRDMPRPEPIGLNDTDRDMKIKMKQEKEFNELLDKYVKNGDVNHTPDPNDPEKLGVAEFKNDEAKDRFIKELESKGVMSRKGLVNELKDRGLDDLAEKEELSLDADTAESASAITARVPAPTTMPGS